MPSKPVFNYDVFISYKSEQESWARRLAELLRSFGLKVWRDHDAGDGIRTSALWRPEIESGLRASRAMVVLWSRKILADAASEVHKEISTMQELVQADRSGQRRFVPLRLDDAPLDRYQALSGYQGDDSFQSLYQQFGDEGASKVSPIAWYGALRPVIDVLGIHDVTEVRFVAAAMTRIQAENLLTDPATYARDQETLKLIYDAMGVTSPFTPERYGASPNDWRPFPQLQAPWRIADIVNQCDRAKRDDAKRRNKFAPWIVVSYSEDLVSPDDLARKRARDAIRTGPCLVIVDPVSLMHRDVFQSLIVNASLHNLPDSFIIGVAPFVAQMYPALFERTAAIDKALEERYLEAAYGRFKEWFVPGNQACVMNVEHEFQFMRWLQVATDNIIVARKTPLRPSDVLPNPLVLERLRQRGGPPNPGPGVTDMSGDGGQA